MRKDEKSWFKRCKAALTGGDPEPSSDLEVTLYTRPGCTLCVKAKEVILRVRKEIPFSYREIDISRSEALEKKYGSEIPVVFVGGRKAFKYRVAEDRLRKSLKARLPR